MESDLPEVVAEVLEMPASDRTYPIAKTSIRNAPMLLSFF